MNHHSILPMMCAGLLLGCGTLCSADETAGAPPPEKTAARQGQPPAPGGKMLSPDGMKRMKGMRGGDPGRMVRKELNAYMADKSDENFQKLEKALGDAMAKDTEKRREMLRKRLELLQKELAELDANQQQRSRKFLDSVKSGEYKPQQDRRPGRPPLRPNAPAKGGAAENPAQ